jgi:uncharacterized protein YheU (UPF0270 family)
MTYYKTWQDALQEFITRFGHEYEDSYNLMSEFEEVLQQNRQGVYYITWRVAK